jgi:hypothetical protein
MPPALDSLIGALIAYGGVPGIIIALVCAVMVWQSHMHRAERKDWREENHKDKNRSHELHDETNRVLRELSVVIAELTRH